MKKIFLTIVLAFMFTPSVFAESITIKNTSWTIYEDDGHETLFNFKGDFSCTYALLKSPSGNEGRIYSNCEWFQNKNVVTISINKFYYTFSAIIEDNKMIGHSYSNTGQDDSSLIGKIN